MTPKRRFLVVARVGNGSLHPAWLQEERTFDLAIDYYGDQPGRWAGSADFVFENKGSKWQGLHALLTAHPFLAEDYDAVWFPDDDIATDASTISAMFALHDELGLGLSQPALTEDSYFTHLMTLRHPGLAVRTTNFVEVMVPLLSRPALAACLPTFAESRSGYGLDLVWQAVLPGLGLKSAIFDCLPVRHTRPLGSGTLYQGMDEPPHVEGVRVARAYGVPTPHGFRVHDVLDDTFAVVPRERVHSTVLRHLPVPTVQQVPAWDLYPQDVRVAAAREIVPARGPRAPRPLGVPARPATGPVGAWTALEDDAPLVVVVAQDATDRRHAWEAAGWRTRVVAPGDREALVQLLEAGERCAARLLDVQERSTTALEQASCAATRAGFEVVVRADVDSLACDHAFPDALRPSLGCTSCAVAWRAIAQPGVIVVAEAAAHPELLRRAPRATVVEHLTVPVPAPAAGAAAVEPPSVVVVVNGAGPALRTCLDALAHQEGLSAPVEVLLVPARPGVLLPAVPPAAGLRPRLVADHGAAGIAAATVQSAGARVLVLDDTDVPGPWMLHRHAGQGVVISPGRARVGAPEDPLTDSISHRVERCAPAARASAPRDLLAGLAGVHAVVSASTARAVLAHLPGTRHLTVPTHTAPAVGDLDELLQACLLDELAGTVAAPATEDLPRAVTAQLTHWTWPGEGVVPALGDLVRLLPDHLRRVPVRYYTGERALEALEEILDCTLTAHAAAAALAVSHARAAAAAHQPILLSVSASDDRLPALLHDLATSELVGRAALQVLVTIAPDTDDRAFAGRLAAELTRRGVPLDVLAHVSLRETTEAATSWREAHVTLPVEGAAWVPGLPVPLLGLAPAAWLAYLEVAVLLQRMHDVEPSPTTADPVLSVQGV